MHGHRAMGRMKRTRLEQAAVSAVGLAICLLAAAAAAAECTYGSEKGMLSRVVAINSANGAIYGMKESHTEAPLPLALNEKELVLTFDQGPHATNTEYILYTLDRFCVKAVFFFSGSAAFANARVVRAVAERGHTLAAGPWSTSPGLFNLPIEDAKAEIDRELTGVAHAAETPNPPFLRLPTDATATKVLSLVNRAGVGRYESSLSAGHVD